MGHVFEVLHKPGRRLVRGQDVDHFSPFQHAGILRLHARDGRDVHSLRDTAYVTARQAVTPGI